MKTSNCANDDETISEIYYIIQRFLSMGPCAQSAQTLKREIEQHELLPKRFDHRGRQHRRTFDEYDRSLHDLIPSNFLQRLCDRIPSLTDLVMPPGISGVKLSLFCGGKQSVLRNKDENITNRWTCSSVVATKSVVSHLPQFHRKTPTFDQLLCARELSGCANKRTLCSDFLTSRLELQIRIFGHLSSIFCVAFDRSGHYIFTGADDNLIKVWSVRDGRLLYTFRGFSGEITDLTVCHENTLLAGGSCDKTIRVWCLRTGTPIAVLQGHSTMVTSLQFLPFVEGEDRWLVSTGNDCCVCFWKWNVVTTQFNPVPIKYAERLRVGGQMICSSHSPGGRFVATGGTDHYVRVYVLRNGWAERVIETDGHMDRVDSVQWAHRGLRFLTGSRDGVAKIWTFERQEWKTIPLIMTQRFEPGKDPVSISATDSKAQRLKVTMVSWAMNDTLVATAVSDFSLRVWDSKSGKHVRCLLGHTDEVFVLEPHPVNSKFLLSAGHDGNLFLWNVLNGELMKKFFNAIEGFGHGAFFDARFSFDAEHLAAVDSHGHLSIFSSDSNEVLRTALREQFFHTDYRPLLRDANQYVIDEQTQVAPHLMPPPFLVNSDGDPYPPPMQRRVPGKENCSDAFLIPVVLRNNERETNEIVDVEAVEVPAASSAPANSIPNEENSSHQESSVPMCAWSTRFIVRPLHQSVLERSIESRRQLGAEEISLYENEATKPPLPVFVAPIDNPAQIGRGHRKSVNHAYGTRRNAVTRPARDFVPHLVPTPVHEVEESSDDDSDYSESEESARNALAESENGSSDDPDYSDVEKRKPLTRRTVVEQGDADLVEGLSDSDKSLFETNVSDGDDKVENDDQPSTSKAAAAKDVSISGASTSTRPKRSRPRRQELYIPDDLEEVAKSRRRTRRVSLASEPKTLADVPDRYLFPDWITSTVPKKSPYFPQVNDEIVYQPVGHRLYIDAVERLNLYPVRPKTLPWNKLEFQDEEFAVVLKVQFEISPVRLCCLKLAQLHGKSGKRTGMTYSVRYHDIPTVVDFIVLRHHYEKSLKRKWKQGDRFQAVIDDGWWFGTILKKDPFDSRFKGSHFQCLSVLWDNGDEEKLSPWDLEPFDSKKCPTKKGASVPVTQEELYALAMYESREDEWPPHGMDTECDRLVSGIEKIMQFSLAEPFSAPVDLNAYPTYCLCVEYPSDLSTIKSRLENKFYRRSQAVESDIRQLMRNASTFNEPKSQIVRQARKLCDILLKYLDAHACEDIVGIYSEEIGRPVTTLGDKTTTTDDEAAETSSREKEKRSRRRKFISTKFENLPSIDGKEWLEDCREIVEMFKSEDNASFSNRRPDEESENSAGASNDNPTTTHLKMIAQKLETEQYENPQEFADDVDLLLQNMKTVTSNKRSKSYLATIRLRGKFQEKMNPIFDLYNQKHQSKPSTSCAYNIRKKNGPLSTFNTNEGIGRLKQNNMIQAYQRSKLSSDNAATHNGGSGIERRRVVVAHSDDTDDETNRTSTASIAACSRLSRSQETPTLPSRTKSVPEFVCTSVENSFAVCLPRRATSKMVNYNENSDEEREKPSNGKVVEAANANFSDDEETENHGRSRNTTSKKRPTRKNGKIDDEVAVATSKSSKKTKKAAKFESTDDDEGEEPDNNEDTDYLTDGSNHSEEEVDVNSEEDVGGKRSTTSKRRGRPPRAKKSASFAATAASKSKSVKKRRYSSASNESDDQRPKRNLRGGDAPTAAPSTSSKVVDNGRTRFGGKRVKRYVESSEEEEDEATSPQVVTSRSSRGRLCKVKKFF